MMRRAGVTIGASLLVAFGPGSLQAAPPCDCKDAKDIIYRMEEAELAIATFRREIAKYGSNEKRTGAPEMFDRARKEALKLRVQAVLDAAARAYAKSAPIPKLASGYTDPHSCSINFEKPGTACLQSAIERHEGFHGNLCHIAMKSKSVMTRVNPLSDYRDGTRMADYAQEEVDAYQVESAYLGDMYRQLPASCKPGWYLYFEVTVRGAASEGTKEPMGEERVAWKIDHKYSGKVELRKGTPRGAPTTWTTQLPLQVPIAVSIQDEVLHYSHEKGEGDSWQTWTKTETWQGAGTDSVVGGSFLLATDPQSRTYKVNIPLALDSARASKPPLLVREYKRKEVQQSAVGYGALKPPVVTDRMVALGTLLLPQVKDLLNHRIAHATQLPFDSRLDFIEFDSGPMSAEAGFLQNLPKVKENLKVRVYYRFSKTPIK